jgi:quercetin dioxygenase-like cupin family protein
MNLKPRSFLFALSAALAITVATPAMAHGPGETVKVDFEKKIPNIPGKSLVAVVVDYAPGAASAPHAHAKSAFVYAYVISGKIESKVDDGPAHVFGAGESFHEVPGSLHPVSRNASATEPARLLAVFVVDDGETGNLTTPTGKR